MDKLSTQNKEIHKIPHVGFNLVHSHPDSHLFKGLPQAADFYFVHSYRMLPNGLSVIPATCKYGDIFLASYEQDNICATQFHPEKSQTNGLLLLQNFYRNSLMLKKRLVFTLLFSNGQFMLSRNFRLQKVGDMKWLQTNYNFSHTSYSIDELIVLDVTRGKKNPINFCNALKQITRGCFAPISAGVGVNTIDLARNWLRSGADKVVINSALYDNSAFISHLASEFGKQCLVAYIDIKAALDGTYQAWTESRASYIEGSAASWIDNVLHADIWELYLNSMDQDGTGWDFNFGLLDLFPSNLTKPVILAGGAGNSNHLFPGHSDSHVDTVATANLFNFVGDGLKQARQSLIFGGTDLPLWDIKLLPNYSPAGIISG